METQAQYVIDANEQNFQTEVVARSMEVPVLVNLWAPWSEDCKALTPFLHALTQEYAGQFILATVNAETSPQIAMAFGAQSVPMTVMVKDGRPVDAFQGAQPEQTIRQFLNRFVTPPEADPLEVGFAALAEKHYEAAAIAFQQVLAKQPENADALIGLARVALGTSRYEEVGAIVDAINKDDSKYDQGQRLKAVLAFAEDAGDVDALEAAVAADPKDVESWYKLGATYTLQQELSKAFEAFLKVVSLDREYREDGGRVSLLSLFEMVGTQDPEVQKARRRLAGLLF